MRVLVVLPFAPWPVRVRSANLWPRIAREAEVHVVAVRDRLPPGQAARPLANVASQTLLGFSATGGRLRAARALAGDTPLRMAWLDSGRLRNEVRRAYARLRPDVVYAERSRAIPLLEGLPPRQVVLDPTDSLPHFYAQVGRSRLAPWRQRRLARIEGGRLAAYESARYEDYARVLACSETDAAWMRHGSPGARIDVVRNGVDIARFAMNARAAGKTRLLMAGNFGYWPNAEAAHWLLGQAAALQESYGAEVVFAGASPTRRLRAAARRRAYVSTPGFVEDIAGAYSQASAVLAPLAFAVGTQNKVLEAMASGRGVAATPEAAAGIGRPGRATLSVAERPRFVEAAGEALSAAPARLAEARDYVETYHDWEAITAALLEVLSDVALGRRAAA